MSTITILGSTGSIGTQALDILKDLPDFLNVHALTAHSNWSLLAKQANRFKPPVIGIAREEALPELKSALTYKPERILSGPDLFEDPSLYEVDTLLNALVGFSGFIPTVKALNKGIKVALANKESLVVGGELIRELIPMDFTRLVPVDTEHSAMLQCLVGEPVESIRSIIITASGGPFRTWTKEQMKKVRVEDALKHPNWSMGSKITIDSATMMNKGLEIIEAHWLFGIPVEKIRPVIHPQSIIHSVIEFIDGSSKAQLGPPDMKVPILYALSSPGRADYPNRVLDWASPFEMTFEPVDLERFPAIRLATEALVKGGFAPCILNAANEIAVQRFLDREIGYIDIHKVVERTLDALDPTHTLTIESLCQIDAEAREFARNVITF